jgi:pimeloyl-ACP methyl ester carboxylesterase
MAFVHPIGMQAEFWEPVAHRLRSRYRTISIDLRGHGESDVPGNAFTLEDLAADCVELLRALSPRPVIVVGCSLGGTIAQAIALQAADLVRGLVLANCSGARAPGSREILEERAAAAMCGMSAVADSTIERWFTPAFAGIQPEAVSTIREWLLDADPVVHAWTWRAMAAREFRPVAARTLTIAGSLDRSTSPAAVKALADALPNAEYREITAGHFAPIEDPGAFADLVAAFADGLPMVGSELGMSTLKAASGPPLNTGHGGHQHVE